MLEHKLAESLGQLIGNKVAGPVLYYGLNSFNQRLTITQATAAEVLLNERHREFAKLLLTRIGRLWSDRNKLVHSNFAHRQVMEFGEILMSAAGRGGKHPSQRRHIKRFFVTGPDGSRERPTDILKQDFGYEVVKAGGDTEFVPVNKGTFVNHADAVGRRCAQVAILSRAIQRGRVKLRAANRRANAQWIADIAFTRTR